MPLFKHNRLNFITAESSKGKLKLNLFVSW
jgi:hypothetical protein